MSRDIDWTPSRLAYLREHYPRVGPVEVAADLDMGTKSVTIEAQRLGLIPPDTASRRPPSNEGVNMRGWGFTGASNHEQAEEQKGQRRHKKGAHYAA